MPIWAIRGELMKKFAYLMCSLLTISLLISVPAKVSGDAQSNASVGFYGSYPNKRKDESQTKTHLIDRQGTSESRKNTSSEGSKGNQELPQTGESTETWLIVSGGLLILGTIVIKKMDKRGKRL